MADINVQIPAEMTDSNSITRIPDISTTSIRLSPSNQSSFVPGDIVYFDIPNLMAAYLNNNSIYLSMKQTHSVGGTNDANMLGIPGYTPLLNHQVYLNSQQLDVINDYNLLCYDIVMTKMTASQKAGLGYALGIQNGQIVGRTCTTGGVNAGVPVFANTTFSTSVPIPNVLSNASRWIPLFSMPPIRLAFQLDSQSNMFYVTPGGAVATTINSTFTNLELCFDVVNIPQSMVNSIMNKYSTIPYKIKSSSYSVSSTPFISAGSSGQLTVTSNTRFSSIKSVFLNCTSTYGNYVNKKYDSVDPTNLSASGIQFEIGSSLYPPKPLDTLNSKSGCMAELCLALYGNRNILSADLGLNYTSTTGFSATEASVSAIGGSTTVTNPASFIVGVNTENISSNSVLLSGADSRNSSINLKLNINSASALAQQIQPRMIIHYDAILRFDVNARNVDVLT